MKTEFSNSTVLCHSRPPVVNDTILYVSAKGMVINMLDYVIGFAVAILSGLGIGGGGLLVIYLSLVLGVGQLEAQGINLIYFLFSSGAAMLIHLLRRRLNFRLIGYLAVCGVVGAVLGSWLAGITSPEVMRRCFGCLLLVSGALALR